MTENKQTIDKYIEGFISSDHEKIISCLTDDISWEVPGMFNITGKDAFDKEMENDNFEGTPSIRLFEWLKKITLFLQKVQYKIKLKMVVFQMHYFVMFSI